jgi:hypothetical protein
MVAHRAVARREASATAATSTGFLRPRPFSNDNRSGDCSGREKKRWLRALNDVDDSRDDHISLENEHDLDGVARYDAQRGHIHPSD